ncbi:hypothetical protein ACFX2I_020406 [Malus domestica]
MGIQVTGFKILVICYIGFLSEQGKTIVLDVYVFMFVVPRLPRVQRLFCIFTQAVILACFSRIDPCDSSSSIFLQLHFRVGATLRLPEDHKMTQEPFV